MLNESKITTSNSYGVQLTKDIRDGTTVFPDKGIVKTVKDKLKHSSQSEETFAPGQS